MCFFQLNTNFLELARNGPMHGILTALRVCLPNSDLPPGFVPRLNEVLTKATRTMLSLLSGRRSGDGELVNASFADMGIAIESLLKSENAAVENDDDDADLGGGDEPNGKFCTV